MKTNTPKPNNITNQKHNIHSYSLGAFIGSLINPSIVLGYVYLILMAYGVI